MAEIGRGELVYRRNNDALVASQATDEPWVQWVREHVEAQIEQFAEGALCESLGELLRDERADNERVVGELRRELGELRIKLAEVDGGLRMVRTGKSFSIKGTFNSGTRYEMHDIVAMDGSSFVATIDNPGPCPGAGWQLMTKAGSKGPRGEHGARGERGEPGRDAVGGGAFKGFHVDSANYVLSIVTSDGRAHEVPLRGLFEQFIRDMRAERAP